MKRNTDGELFGTMPFTELGAYSGDRSCVIIDLREREQYERRHIEGAWNIPYGYLGEAVSMLPKRKRLLFYCERGSMAMEASRRLAALGFETAAAIGGYDVT